MCRGKGKKGCKKTKNAAKKNGRARKKDSAKRGGKPPRTRKGNNGNKPKSDRRQRQRKTKTKKNNNDKNKNTNEVKAKENEQKFSGITTGQGRQITGNATSCAMKAIKYARLFEGKATSIFRQVGILNILMMWIIEVEDGV